MLGFIEEPRRRELLSHLSISQGHLLPPLVWSSISASIPSRELAAVPGTEQKVLLDAGCAGAHCCPSQVLMALLVKMNV